jgi:hypothetical protein
MNGTARSKCSASRTAAVLIIIALLITLPVPAMVNAQTVPPDPRFGAVEAFYDPQAAQDLNLGWERILFYWAELQGSGQNADWNIFHVQDGWLADAAAHGRQVVGLIEKTPQWATDGRLGTGVPRGLYLPIDDPNNLWASFVRTLVARYAGRVDHWIIWNEPDVQPPDFGVQFDGTEADYYQLVKVAYLVAKQANPNAVIHLAGLTYYHDTTHHRVAYLQRFINAAKKDPTAAAHHDYFDIATLHIYYNSDEVYNVTQIIRNILRQNGLKQPLWINETNAQPSDDPLNTWQAPTHIVSLDQQAGFLVKSFAMGLAAGADRLAVYKLIDIPPPLPGWPPDGLIRSDGTRRPAYAALKTITTYYRNTRAARLVRTGSTDVVTLDRGSQTTRIAWARGASTTTVSLPAFAQQATLVAVDGTTQPLAAIDNQYRLTVPGAKCDDPTFGCAVGGAPIILVEDAPAKFGGSGSIVVSTITPTAIACTNCTATPTQTLTATLTPEPAPTATPTLTPEPTSTSTATPTVSPSRTSTSTPQLIGPLTPSADPPIGLFALGAAIAILLIIIARRR